MFVVDVAGAASNANSQPVRWHIKLPRPVYRHLDILMTRRNQFATPERHAVTKVQTSHPAINVIAACTSNYRSRLRSNPFKSLVNFQPPSLLLPAISLITLQPHHNPFSVFQLSNGFKLNPRTPILFRVSFRARCSSPSSHFNKPELEYRLCLRTKTFRNACNPSLYMIACH